VKILHLGYIGAVSLQGVIQRGEPAQRGGDDPIRVQRLDAKVRGLIELATFGGYQTKVNADDGKPCRPPDCAVPVDGLSNRVAGVLLGPICHTEQGVAGGGVEGQLGWVKNEVMLWMAGNRQLRKGSPSTP
jgi:hypothetical protein